MLRARRLAAAIAVSILAVVPAACGGGGGDAAATAAARVDTAPADAAGASTAAFTRDATAVGKGLQRYGAILQAVDTRRQLAARRGTLDAIVRTVGARLDAMAGYRLDDAALERKRSALVEHGRPLLVLMGRLDAAVATASPARLGDLAGRIQSATQALRTALR